MPARLPDLLTEPDTSNRSRATRQADREALIQLMMGSRVGLAALVGVGMGRHAPHVAHGLRIEDVPAPQFAVAAQIELAGADSTDGHADVVKIVAVLPRVHDRLAALGKRADPLWIEFLDRQRLVRVCGQPLDDLFIGRLRCHIGRHHTMLAFCCDTSHRRERPCDHR